MGLGRAFLIILGLVPSLARAYTPTADTIPQLAEWKTIIKKLYDKPEYLDYLLGDRWGQVIRHESEILTKTWFRKPRYFAGLSVDQKIEKLLPLWMPYFNQILAREHVDAKTIAEMLSRGKLANRLRAEIRSPLTQTNTTAGTTPMIQFDIEAVDRFIKLKIKEMMNTETPGRLKILLGGTLSDEVRLISASVLSALRFEARGRGVSNFEDWVQRGPIEIVGYSIATDSLINVQKMLLERSISEVERKWIRLEYIDLLDPLQVERMEAEHPQLVLTSSSLYLASLFGGMSGASSRKKLLERQKPCRFYTEKIYQMLSPGGLFVIEQQGVINIQFPPFITLPPKAGGKFSGLFYKPEGESEILPQICEQELEGAFRVLE